MRSKHLNSKDKRSNPNSWNWFFVYFIWPCFFFLKGIIFCQVCFFGSLQKFGEHFFPTGGEPHPASSKFGLCCGFRLWRIWFFQSCRWFWKKKSLVNFWMFVFFGGGRGKGVWKRGICWNNLRKSRAICRNDVLLFFWIGQVVFCISVKRWHHQNCWIFFLRGKAGAKEA